MRNWVGVVAVGNVELTTGASSALGLSCSIESVDVVLLNFLEALEPGCPFLRLIPVGVVAVAN